jgi:ABC-type transport system substrate-binding protein
MAVPADINTMDTVGVLGPIDGEVDEQLIYEHLLEQTAYDQAPTPGLATSVTPNSDLTSWTVKLRQGVQFQDGTTFDAQAVKFNMDRQMAPGGSGGDTTAPIKSVTVVDDSTVRFDLKFAWANLPAAMTLPPFLMGSPTAIQKYGKTYNQHPTGTGPFMLDTYTPGAEIDLKRNPTFWNAKSVYLDKIVIKIIPNPTSAYQALLAGNVDVLFGALSKDIVASKSNPKLKYVQIPGVVTGSNLVSLNVTKPPLNDVRVRLALNYAVDRQAIVTGLSSGMSLSSQGPFAGSRWDNHVKFPTFDLAKAQSLIAEYKQSTGATTVSFALDTFGPDAQRGGQVLQAMWAKIGVDVKLNVYDVPTQIHTLLNGDFQAKVFNTSVFPTPDFVFYSFVTTGSPLNLSRSSVPAVDAAMKAARASTDLQVQKQQYGIVNQWLADQSPIIWTDTLVSGWLYSTSVHGSGLNATTGLRIPNLGGEVWVSR